MNNPFLQRLTPNLTEQSTTSTYTPPPGPPPSASPPSSAQPPGPQRQDSTDVLVEAPPPYSAAPAPWNGESTVEYGPSRPFQPAPAPLRPVPSQWTPPEQSHSPSSIASTYSSPSGRPAPPRHPSTLSPPAIPTRRAASDAALRRRVESSSSTTLPNTYRPPPGPPPQSASFSSGTPAPPLQRRNNDNGVGNAADVARVPADGKPTREPREGHPLMNQGHVLVYPPRYTCPKCFNLGYKNLDVTHPCRKCWQKYGRAYEGALIYADWKDATTNFQRPLPRQPAPRAPVPLPNQQPYFGGHVYNAPPPGALVVQPGDPRIGGRLCYNCGGDGLISSLFFFDEETCRVCNGTGRVF